MLTCGFAEARLHYRGGARPVSAVLEAVAGVVVEPGGELGALGARYGVWEAVGGGCGVAVGRGGGRAGAVVFRSPRGKGGPGAGLAIAQGCPSPRL